MVDRGDQHEQGTVRWRGGQGQVEGRVGSGGGEGRVRCQVAGNKDPTLHPGLPLRSPGLEHFSHRTSELGLLPCPATRWSLPKSVASVGREAQVQILAHHCQASTLYTPMSSSVTHTHKDSVPAMQGDRIWSTQPVRTGGPCCKMGLHENLKKGHILRGLQ